MVNQFILFSKIIKQNETSNIVPVRVFSCKTCNKEFMSFQALGGHRASHKKIDRDINAPPSSPKKSKPTTHECTICGLEFPIGQALGGHMRRHRNKNGDCKARSLSPVMLTMKKQSSKERFLWLDLNLTPVENDMKRFELGRLIC